MGSYAKRWVQSERTKVGKEGEPARPLATRGKGRFDVKHRVCQKKLRRGAFERVESKKDVSRNEPGLGPKEGDCSLMRRNVAAVRAVCPHVRGIFEGLKSPWGFCVIKGRGHKGDVERGFSSTKKKGGPSAEGDWGKLRIQLSRGGVWAHLKKCPEVRRVTILKARNAEGGGQPRPLTY